jgi:hypothetical protein
MKQCSWYRLSVAVVATAVAVVGLLPVSASSQCVEPNLVVNDATCVAGQSCVVSVNLASDGQSFAAALATITSSGPIACAACEPGVQAAGICVLNAETCTWNVSDFSLQPFSDGEIALISVVCAAPGVYSLDLSDVSLGRTNGIPQLSCGVSAQLDCEACESNEQCDDGNACTVNDACTAGACVREDFCGVPMSRGFAPVASDALFTLRAAIAIESCPPCECDVDSSGVITASDALAVLQSSVGLPVDLNCFMPEPQ